MDFFRRVCLIGPLLCLWVYPNSANAMFRSHRRTQAAVCSKSSTLSVHRLRIRGRVYSNGRGMDMGCGAGVQTLPAIPIPSTAPAPNDCGCSPTMRR